MGGVREVEASYLVIDISALCDIINDIPGPPILADILSKGEVNID